MFVLIFRLKLILKQTCRALFWPELYIQNKVYSILPLEIKNLQQLTLRFS